MEELPMAGSVCFGPCLSAKGEIISLDDEVFFRESFGARAAQQMNAEIDEDRAKPLDGSFGEATAEDKVLEGGSLPALPLDDYHERLAVMDFEQRVLATEECLNRRSSFRNILYGLLGFCVEEKTYEEIESFCVSFSEFKGNRQEPRRYVFTLLRTGALEEIELDEAGNPLTEEMKRQAVEGGLNPDDLDTLVFDWRIVTTDPGKVAYEDFSPKARLADLIASFPEREEAFVQIMNFLREPRSMGAIDEAFKGKNLLGVDEATRLNRQPSSYIHKLDGTGAIEWSGSAWWLTQTGRDYLDERGD